MSTKTEPPTLQRLQRATAAGDLPVSRRLVGSAVLLVAVALLPAAVRATAARAEQMIVAAIHSPTTEQVASRLTTDVLALVLPILSAMAVAGAAAGMAQTGGRVSLGAAAPDLRRATGSTPLRAMLSAPRIVAAAGTVAVAVVVATVTGHMLVAHGADLAAAVGNRAAIVVLVEHWCSRLAWIAALLGLALGAVHLVAVRRSWRERLWMTPAELRREQRASHGAPEARAARRRAHQKLAGAPPDAA